MCTTLIKTVVFDVDDTIYDQQDPFRQAIQKVIPNVLEKDMHDIYIRFRHHSDENFPKVLAKLWSLEKMRERRIVDSLTDLGYPAIDQEQALLFQEVYEKELDNIKMHPEVKKTLNYLKEKHIPMGIITNGPTDHQYKKIKQLHLTNWVDPKHIIVSQATGFQKPEVEIFQLAEKNFDLDPATTLYVGDNFDNDVAGAKNSTWKALWFNHRDRKLPCDATTNCDIEINSFAQLLPLMETIC